MAQCSKCGSDNVVMKSGISQKSGKPWKGFKCQDCDNMDFVRTQQSQGANKFVAKGKNESYGTMILAYAKDIVVAEIGAGALPKEPFKRVCDGYKALLTAYAHPFGEPKPQAEPEPEKDDEEEADETF